MYVEEQVPKYQNCVLVGLVLFAVATSVTMAQYKIPTIMTDIMQRFNTDAGMVSWFMSIFTLVGIVAALPTGFLIQRAGPKTVILIAVVLDLFAACVGAFVTDPILLLGTRAFEGVALVFVIACAPIVIQTCVDPSKTGTAMGIYMLGGMLGAVFAGLLTPILYCGIGYVGLWLTYAAITAASGVLVAVFIKSPRNVMLYVDGQEKQRMDKRHDVEDDMSKAEGNKVFFRPNTWLFFAAFAIFQMVLLTILSYAPTSLQQQGMTPALSGLVSTLPMLLAILSSTTFGAISDKTGRCKPLCVAGMLVLGPCAYIMLNCSGPVMWAALILMGLVAMGAPTVFVAAYPRILGDPKLLSVGMGVLLLVQSLGQFLGTFVSSAVLGSDLNQWMLCGAVAMFLGFIGAICIAICRFK